MTYSTGYTYVGRSRLPVFARQRTLGPQRTSAGHAASAHRATLPEPAPEWERITDADRLFAIFCELKATKGQTPGLDRLRYSDFTETEIRRALDEVVVALNTGTYRPYATRLVRIPKPKGGDRKLRLLNIVDRVVATAVHEELIRFLEPLSSNCSHGGRIGRDRLTLLAMLYHDITDGYHWLNVEDIRQAFDCVDFSLVSPLLPQIVPEDRLRRLIQTMFAKPSGAVGIDQGNACSMDLLNALLNFRLDRPLADAGLDTPRVLRFVDDLCFATRNASSSGTTKRRIVELLTELGMSLKNSGRTANLSRQGTGIEVLGLRLTLKNGQPMYSVTEKSWQELEQALTKAHFRSDPVLEATSILTGWLTAQGPALENAEQADRVLRQVRHTTEHLGIREAFTRNEGTLVEHIWKTAQRWASLRDGASRGLTHGNGDTPSGTGALRDANPPLQTASDSVGREQSRSTDVSLST